MIYFTSDLHIGHDRGFIFKPRGFETIEEQDGAIVDNWNKKVSTNDETYVLGDLMLGDNEHGINVIKQLNGKIHVILGNHDTQAREKLYKSLPKIVSVKYADMLKYGKYTFYLSHYPTMTSNFGGKSLCECVIDLFGHTHSSDKFYEDMPWMYNVALDANDNAPISIEEIIKNCRDKAIECKSFL